MRDAPHMLIYRAYKKFSALLLYPQLRKYRAGINAAHPLFGVPTRMVGDASANPTEFFDHYDAFGYWVAKKLSGKTGRQSTLDIGSVKLMNAMLSASHDVTALVLADCGDQISSVKYIKHDVSDRLPFGDNVFDVFTSSVSLPLVGLGRYGDKLNPACLPHLIDELDRVMKAEADLLISMCLGRNVLNFNNGWFLDMPTIEKLFPNWRVVDHLVDNQSSPKGWPESKERFTRDTSVEGGKIGNYRVIFLHLTRVVPNSYGK